MFQEEAHDAHLHHCTPSPVHMHRTARVIALQYHQSARVASVPVQEDLALLETGRRCIGIIL